MRGIRIDIVELLGMMQKLRKRDLSEEQIAKVEAILKHAIDEINKV
jgi:ribosomal protein S13